MIRARMHRSIACCAHDTTWVHDYDARTDGQSSHLIHHDGRHDRIDNKLDPLHAHAYLLHVTTHVTIVMCMYIYMYTYMCTYRRMLHVHV